MGSQGKEEILTALISSYRSFPRCTSPPSFFSVLTWLVVSVTFDLTSSRGEVMAISMALSRSGLSKQWGAYIGGGGGGRDY